MLETFLALLNGEATDAVVWTADLSYWMSGRKRDGTADRSWETEEGCLELHRRLGVMPYYYYDKFWAGEACYDASVRARADTTGNRTVRTIETPAGTLREESVYLAESACSGIVKHMVETEADLDVLLSALEHRRLEPRNLNDYPERRALWARYDGLPSLGLPRSPLSALAYEWAGIANLAILMADAPDKVGEAMARMEAQERPVLEAVCELAPPLVHFPDNLSSDNLTGYYDRYMRPGHRRRLEALHSVGIRAAVHLDGTVGGLLPKLVASGFDAVEALTPKPAGDLSAEEMGAIAGGRTILWGGVPGVMFAPPYTWDDMRHHVEHVLETWGGHPFVLGVADQIPPDGDIDFCMRIREMIGGG